MITEERLQEMKERYEQEDGLCLYTDIAVKDILDLIAAYENQGELLQLALGNTDKLNEKLEEAQAALVVMTDQFDDAAKIATAAQAELAGADDFANIRHAYIIEINELKKQLAEAADEQKWTIKYREAIMEDKAMARKLAEVELLYANSNELVNDNVELIKELRKTQAEVERLRIERNEWEATAKNYASMIIEQDKNE